MPLAWGSGKHRGSPDAMRVLRRARLRNLGRAALAAAPWAAIAAALQVAAAPAIAGPPGWAEALSAASVTAAPQSAAAASAQPRAQAAKPLRVASLNLSADEVLAEILPPGRLVSVTQWADVPGTSNVAGRVPRDVHRFVKADMEQLVALRPDLVVVSEYTDADFLKQLERSGLRAHRMLGLHTLAGVRGAILELGRATGEDAAVRRLVAGYDLKLAELARRLAGAAKPRVLYWSGNMTAGADTAIGALVEAAGASNVGREMGITGIAPPGAERVFATNPDVVLVGTWPGSREALTWHALLSQWAAVREDRIVAMRTELLVALSQFTADAAWELGHLLHPDRVPALPPSLEPRSAAPGSPDPRAGSGGPAAPRPRPRAQSGPRP